MYGDYATNAEQSYPEIFGLELGLELDRVCPDLKGSITMMQLSHKNDFAYLESAQNSPSRNVFKFAEYPMLVFVILGMFVLGVRQVIFR